MIPGLFLCFDFRALNSVLLFSDIHPCLFDSRTVITIRAQALLAVAAGLEIPDWSVEAGLERSQVMLLVLHFVDILLFHSLSLSRFELLLTSLLLLKTSSFITLMLSAKLNASCLK